MHFRNIALCCLMAVCLCSCQSVREVATLTNDEAHTIIVFVKGRAAFYTRFFFDLYRTTLLYH